MITVEDTASSQWKDFLDVPGRILFMAVLYRLTYISDCPDRKDFSNLNKAVIGPILSVAIMILLALIRFALLYRKGYQN